MNIVPSKRPSSVTIPWTDEFSSSETNKSLRYSKITERNVVFRSTHNVFDFPATQVNIIPRNLISVGSRAPTREATTWFDVNISCDARQYAPRVSPGHLFPACWNRARKSRDLRVQGPRTRESAFIARLLDPDSGHQQL